MEILNTTTSINKLYKYRNFNDENLEKIIKNSSLYYSPVENFNDPFDCKLSFKQNYSKKEIRDSFIAFKERNPNFPRRLKDITKIYGKEKDFIDFQNKITKQMIASIGVLSLSANSNNILMWSHYSHNHTGLVFEFTPQNTNDKHSCFYAPVKVEYSEVYEELSYINNQKEELLKLILTKYNDWSYEEEYRCIDLEFQGEKKFHKNELTGIVFGAKATQENINHIIQLCNDNDYVNVSYKKAMLKNGSFSLLLESIDV